MEFRNARYQPINAFFVGYPSCRMVALGRIPSLMKSLTARIRSSYEYMNYLQVVQDFVRTSHGRKTKEGIARSAAHLVDHGRETREKRKRRSELSNERRALELQMIAMGQVMPAIRGPRTSSFERYLKQRKKTELAAQKRAKLKLGLP